MLGFIPKKCDSNVRINPNGWWTLIKPGSFFSASNRLLEVICWTRRPTNPMGALNSSRFVLREKKWKKRRRKKDRQKEKLPCKCVVLYKHTRQISVLRIKAFPLGFFNVATLTRTKGKWRFSTTNTSPRSIGSDNILFCSIRRLIDSRCSPFPYQSLWKSSFPFTQCSSKLYYGQPL